jgi:CheY-like chemotaxis protein
MPHKLLLADDSVTIQRVIELTFADEDVQVIAVGNGQDAIDRVQRDQPDIVLADIGMPERNGYEVAAFVKGNPATAHIPVVLLTGAFEPIDEGRARTVGCDGVLVKPFEPQLVISRVKDLLAGKQPSGMWSSAPPAQGPVRHAQPDMNPHKVPAQGGGDPLEAYFDQLDAAFSGSSSETAQHAAPPSPAKRESIPLARRPAPADDNDPLSGWDPELQGDPARPAPREPLIPQRTAAAATAVAPPAPFASAAQPPAPQAAPPAPAAAQLPTSLVDAFAALLAAEQKTGFSPSAASSPHGAPTPAPPAPITDEMIEQVTQRVLARLSDQARPSILDVAERLVREEIERIKNIG